jgi:DNA-binding response OmpR family regulator
MKTHNKTSVLLVEDDAELRNTISENLNAVDYKVYAAKKVLKA